MRHKVAGYKLKRPVDSRDSLLRNLATSVIDQERVITTVPKAKAVRPLVEKMITLAKADTLHARRSDRLRHTAQGLRLAAREILFSEVALSTPNLGIFL